MLFAMAPNIINQKVLQWYFRFAVIIFHVLLVLYWIWFPISVSKQCFHLVVLIQLDEFIGSAIEWFPA